MTDKNTRWVLRTLSDGTLRVQMEQMVIPGRWTPSATEFVDFVFRGNPELRRGLAAACLVALGERYARRLLSDDGAMNKILQKFSKIV